MRIPPAQTGLGNAADDLWGVNAAEARARSLVMRLLVAGTIAVGLSFALGAWNGGDQGIAMATAMAAFACAAAMTRALSSHRVRDLHL